MSDYHQPPLDDQHVVHTAKPSMSPDTDGASNAEPRKLSRRKLLAGLGATGLAATSVMLWNGDNSRSVWADVYTDSSRKKHGVPLPSGCCFLSTISDLRALTAPDPDAVYYVTDPGQEGFFSYDSLDSTSADNTGTVLVSGGGARFKRHLSDVLSASWFGTKGDGVTVNTAAFQAALDAAAGKTLYIPKQHGPFYLTGQLFVASNTTIELESGTIIQAVDTLSRIAPYERLLRLKMVQNVVIRGNGATLRMNKTAYTSSEQAHCVDISGSRNVVIENLNCNDSGGDGFYVGAYEVTAGYGVCRDIILRDCSADNNRRQGLSVISVDVLLVENCRFTNTKGTAPEAGVDLEPNGQNQPLRRIRFKNCLAEGNAGAGFLTALLKPTRLSPLMDVTFEDCTTQSNLYGFSINSAGEGANAPQGEIRLIDCIAEEAQSSGFWDIGNSSDSLRRSYIRCRAINCQTTQEPDSIYGFSASFVVTCATSKPRVSIGNVEMIDCQSIDTRAAPLVKHGFALKKRSAQKISDVRFFNCTTIGGNQNTYLIDSVAEQVTAVNHPQPRHAVAASASVSYNWLGAAVTNQPALGNITLTLPVAKAEIRYTFVVDAAFQMKLQASGSGGLLTPDGPKSFIASSLAGSTITLRGRADLKWEIVSAVGDWLTDSGV
ncbi:right-handed parallel beta-helix repeat-containing protein [Paenibacillus hodogayensis]|uniref:Right-handed parallel beta-helix repeat-containing protein n=1 Tax=Paenibacillus hodogayensis TaxID=279208 RepID=A0ABV5W1Q8_9BACL